jgi:hypothetical protein
MAKGCDDGAEPVWGMLDAIDQVVGVLALEALVEREGLQAGEADESACLTRSVAIPFSPSSSARISVT